MSEINLEETSQRVERLLDELRSTAGPDTAEKAELLVKTLLDLYGVALERIVRIAEPAADVVQRLLNDRLVTSLLILHGLHPVDVDTRIQRALDTVRPYLGSHAGGVEYLGIDNEGVVSLRLQGSCSGCPSSTLTVKLAVERAIMDAAPEITRVEAEGIVEEPSAPALLQIGSRPGSDESSWTRLDELTGVHPGMTATRTASGVPILICNVSGTLYAYIDVCAACDSRFENALLDKEILRCRTCNVAYDVRLAGRSIDGRDDLHLDPLPMLPENAGWKIAVPKAGVPKVAVPQGAM